MRLFLLALALLGQTACGGGGRSLPSGTDGAPPETAPDPTIDIVPTCHPMDAVGAGTCGVQLGYRWDGSRCRAVSGCACSGTACSFLFSSEHDCLSAMAGRCLPCDAMQASVTGACMAEFGFFWNGLSCHSASGCSCVGPGCDEPFDTREACELAYHHCSTRTPVTAPCVRTVDDTCVTDTDCVTGGCGGELCYNPNQEGGATDCDCGPPSGLTCGCVGGTCRWWH